MKVTTDNKDLLDLYTTGQCKDKKLNKLQPQVIRAFVKTINKLKCYERVELMMRDNGLNYERLSGEGGEFESVRINLQYRLIIQTSADGEEVTITNVKLIKITNHYADL
ncbi:addiction module killer protein [Sodaliphilus sp.]|uniref:addiction module killer protein n=1 Tax=Sodaliphilus sp. TaxID=2815818 RepID=UPI00388DCC1E